MISLRERLASPLRSRSRSTLLARLACCLLYGSAAAVSAEIVYWVDDQGVTHFSDDPSGAPEGVPSATGDDVETLRAVWGEGVVGPTITRGESSFGDDRVARLLRGAMADFRRGEMARADSALRGVLRLDPRRAEAHWYLSLLARGRGRFSTAERHLRLFLDTSGPELGPWRERAKERLLAIEDERRLADPERLQGPLELQSIRDANFRVQVDARLGEVSGDYAKNVLGFLGEARADVSRSIGVSPLEPLGVVLYGRAAYVRAHAHRFSFQTIGFFDGRIHVASPAHPSDSLRGVLFHEYTHAVFREVTGDDRPYWLNEGLAEQIERQSRGRGVSTRSERAALRANIEMNEWIPLRSIAQSFSGLDDEEARYAYLQSVVTVGYLHTHTSVDERRRMLERIGEGFSIDQALHEAMGIDTDGLDAAVRAEIRREFPEWTLPAAGARDLSALEGAKERASLRQSP